MAPLEVKDLELLEGEEKEEYENTLAKYFTPLVDDLPPIDAAPVQPPPGKKGGGPPAPAPPPAVSVITPGVYPSLSNLSLVDRERYQSFKRYMEVVQERVEREKGVAYITSHPPLTKDGEKYVEVVGLGVSDILPLFISLRDQSIQATENESVKKLLKVAREVSEQKAERTSELEERVRGHWPRRGRVETGVRQPRERELTQHNNKTYRLILAFQKRVIDLEGRVRGGLEGGRGQVEGYKREMGGLVEALGAGDFKNLAAIQVMH